MTLGTGIFASTVLLLLAAAIRQITIRKKWKLVGKFAAGVVAVCVLLGIGVYVWDYQAGLRPAPSVVTQLGGAKLGMSPTEIKLAMGKPDAASDPSIEGAQTRIDYNYTGPSIQVTFYGADKFNTKAEIICNYGSEENLLGFNKYDSEEEVVAHLGAPDSSSVNSEGLAKLISYAKWKASFYISKGTVTTKCIHSFPNMSFANEMLSPEAQKAADTKEAAEKREAAQRAALQAARERLAAQEEQKRSAQSGAKGAAKALLADTSGGTDPCAVGLSKQERVRRLGALGSVRQTGPEMYEAGGRTVMFGYGGDLNYCH